MSMQSAEIRIAQRRQQMHWPYLTTVRVSGYHQIGTGRGGDVHMIGIVRQQHHRQLCHPVLQRRFEIRAVIPVRTRMRKTMRSPVIDTGQVEHREIVVLDHDMAIVQNLDA
jgi:hypothetical protein